MMRHMKAMRHKKRISEVPLHLMVLPALILVLVYSYLPMFGVLIAFQDFSPTTLFTSEWVGLENFKYILQMPGSLQVLWNTIFISFLKIAGMIVVPVTFALLLNEVAVVRFKRAFQSLIYLPYFLSWIILSGILIDILSPSQGIVNHYITLLGGKSIFFLAEPGWFPSIMVVSDIWKNFGFGTVVYLAALTNIDPTQYEAATVDGANRWQQTLYVTLPGIAPIIILMTVLSLGNVLNAGFDQIFNLYNPAVYQTGDIIDTFVYRLGIEQAQYSPATAVGLFKSVVSFVFVSLSYLLADRVAKYRIF